MGKFSDPNYKLLKSYFDILVAERVGTQKSVLIGPNRTVVSQGGVYTILYEDNSDRGYVGHRFKIKEIVGNRFKMTYEGLESTFSVASSAFDIGNEMYFRKDSFFHYWLARPEQDDLYHNYCNQEKTFLFFGKIWPVSNEINTYSIEFEGLKDFTLKGIPQHNQTVNMEEWLKVYWDQVHHEMYNMTKTFWSMFDAKEIDIRWLAYIASTYGVEISEEVLDELSLREWVENLPYFLKRIGTYNALYIVWKLFSKNTSNHLNIYERWGEWCVQNIDDTFGKLTDEFEDYHFLEFYGIQPSGGAGDYYYSRYNPDNYPVHTRVAPSGNCLTFAWDTGTEENYILFNYDDLNCSVGDIKENQISITEYDPTRLTTQTIYLSAATPIYSGNFIHSIGIKMDENVYLNQPSNLVFWSLSNEVAQISDHVGDYIYCSFEASGSNIFFRLGESKSGIENSTKSTYVYTYNTPYYLTIDRTDAVLRVRVYSTENRLVGDLLETFSLSLSSVNSYSILTVLNGKRITGHQKWSGTIYGLSLNNTYTQTITNSGYPVITPHYKVQVDLSTEPLGDIFDNDTIISEDIIDELITNFDYVKPVNKYAHYEELIAPLAKVDRIGDSVALYPKNSNGFMNTFFTGSRFISAGGRSSGGFNTDSHFQQFASKKWTITHNLNSKYILVQPWVFVGPTSVGAKLVQPDTVHMLSDNAVELTFNESVRGVAAIAGSAANGISFYNENYVSAGADIWNITHNLSTNTPSGYIGTSAAPGPIAMHWDTNGYRVIPYINDIPTQDIIQTTWNTAVSGGSLVRRSDYIHNQYDPSTKWSIEHKLNSWVIVQCYDITTYETISPDRIVIIDQDNLEIYWAENKRGYAHIIQVLRDRVVYSPYNCDILGIGICPDVLGYWKVGTGTSTLWNPFVENDLESPVTSGAYEAIEQYGSQQVLVDFIVPKDYSDVDITEVGLFNYLDDLIMYSRCSTLHKPEGVQCFFHYRIEALNSSSSSSTSSSSSSSVSSSSISSSSSSESTSSSSSSSTAIVGELFAWGFNPFGQLGLNDTDRRSSPTQVGSDTTWKEVDMGALNIVIKLDGTLWTCGYGSNGGLGNGSTSSKSVLTQVGALTDWEYCSTDGISSCLAIKTDGTLWSWGYNNNGQLGDGTIVSKSSPIQIGALTDWAVISQCQYTCHAIKTDGTLWSWGSNLYGQLGLGDQGATTHRSSPTQVGSDTNWSNVKDGTYHTIAVKTDGTLWSWGRNLEGQLGDGTIVSKSSPVQIGALTDWSDEIAGSELTSHAVKTDGTLWSWGNNTDLQLGLTGGAVNSPTQVGTDTWSSVYSGINSTFAIKTDGTLWSWGNNSYGQLADGTIISHSLPEQVGSETDWLKIGSTDQNQAGVGCAGIRI